MPNNIWYDPTAGDPQWVGPASAPEPPASPEPAPPSIGVEDVVRDAVLNVLFDALPTRDAYPTWDRNLLAYDIAGRITGGVLAALAQTEPEASDG